MCGITGYIGKRQASEVVLYGLQLLEYRGYDSAGVAVNDGTHINIRRKVYVLQRWGVIHLKCAFVYPLRF